MRGIISHFIFLSLYFVIPYSEFVITALILWYFKGGEKPLRKGYDVVTKKLPQWMTVGKFCYLLSYYVR